MPSPFPGMDPYIESWIWGDFHGRMITAICEELNPRLPKRYIASIDLFIRRVDPASSERALMGPDLYVAGRKKARPNSAATTARAAATVQAPYTSVLPGVVAKQKYVKIIDPLARRIVTVIEILSPANKTAGKDGDAYLYKRDEYIGSGINLVEIDLLRNGRRPPFGLPAPPKSDYCIAVHRKGARGEFGIWPFSVRERIPPVGIPLDSEVADVELDLRKCMDHVYEFGRYDDQLDYRQPPESPLRKHDATWTRELFAARRPS